MHGNADREAAGGARQSSPTRLHRWVHVGRVSATWIWYWTGPVLFETSGHASTRGTTLTSQYTNSSPSDDTERTPLTTLSTWRHGSESPLGGRVEPHRPSQVHTQPRRG